MPTNTSYKPVHINEYTSGALNFNGMGVTGVCSANATTNIDLTLTEDHILTGCVLVIENPTAGDTMALQIVHPVYGVVNQFGTSWHTGAESFRESINIPYPAKLSAGLTIRSVYTSTSSTPPTFVGINYFLHKVLI